MSVTTLITDIKIMIFGKNKRRIISKVTPLFDDNMIDIETGEKKQQDIDIYLKPANYDLEMGAQNIIREDVKFTLENYKQLKTLNNSVSFVDVISYIGSSFMEKEDEHNIYPTG